MDLKFLETHGAMDCDSFISVAFRPALRGVTQDTDDADKSLLSVASN